MKYIELDRDSETLEMMIGQGLLECEMSNGGKTGHPILLKKVSMEFDAVNNIIRIVDTDVDPDILKSLAHRLHSESRYVNDCDAAVMLDDKLLVFNKPVFFIRKRTSGVVKAIEEILLSKEANREQLEIANLMGHFLAQGKSVLVTSHTKKALAVVKEKVAPKLQNLCVSVLDDNSKDMERSIDGITDFISSHSSLELLQNTVIYSG